MSRHARDVLGRELAPSHRQGLRVTGWTALSVSLFMVAGRVGWPIGAVEWVGMLTASAVSFVILLTYRPRLAAGLGLALPVCAAVASLMTH